MGVKHLWVVLESCKKTLPLHHLQNKRLCIDLSCWMVQLQKANKQNPNDKLFLRGLFHRLRALIALNCSLILVTDGSIPAIKLSTYRRRLNGNYEVFHEEDYLGKETSLQRNKGSTFSCQIKEAKALGLALGIPCLDGIEEGESQCALLNSESLCDGCFSSDSDIFLFGARTVYRAISLGEGGHVVCYEMDDIERKLGLGRNSLITLALLLGSDYSPGIHGVGPESACQIVKSVGDSVILQHVAAEGLSFLKKKKKTVKGRRLQKGDDKENLPNQELNMKGPVSCSEKESQFLQVIDAYLKPKCHSADSKVVHRILSKRSFQRTKLHQLCSWLFDWPPEKTDEYILPKIAERDLRRFANLRSTSAALGTRLPLRKIPAKCPVKEIIKHRIVQGKDCFEVSWENFDGLETSVVPEDLIQSACPEKIVEFNERINQQKVKKSSRPQPSAIDQKLQALLLEIESENSTKQNASSSTSAAMLEQQNNATECDYTTGYYSFNDLDSENNTASHHLDDAKSEFIDLLSPSPAPSLYKSRCQQTTAMRPDTLLESEGLYMSFNLEPESNDREYQPTVPKTKIINLLSPSPVQSRKMSRCQQTTAVPSNSPIRTMLDTNADCHSETQPNPAGETSPESEIIDLSSPHPPIRHNSPHRNVVTTSTNQYSNVVDLSEYEFERSPEHERKARELRLFLSSIKYDL